ncbi:hypothetical protein RUM44_001984 [Polyplax serrata]|uniref:Uncharacterized protein n=1 Tax=Polyplax serrata TaxID=468196 RepID=A0ABR1AM99_POLSC
MTLVVLSCILLLLIFLFRFVLIQENIKITEKAERDPTTGGMTSLTKSIVSRDVVGSAKIPWDCQEISDTGKLTIEDPAGGQSDSKFPRNGQPLVTCQNPYDRDVREKFETAPETPDSRLRPTEEMPQCERSGGGSKYQTKLTVTLKTPTVKQDAKLLPGKPMSPRSFQSPHHQQQQNPPRYGLKPEFSILRFQTFPNAGCQTMGPRVSATNGRDCLVNHYGGVRSHANGLSGSLPRLPGLIPKAEVGLNASHIPVKEFDSEIDVLPGEESLSGSGAQPLLKPVKIPPVPPPRTSSCPKTIIPASLLGSSAVHQRVNRKGKTLDQAVIDPIMYNPLLLSQPIATSSPTISIRATKYGGTSSSENLYTPRCQKQGYQDESSTEDLTKQKYRFREDMNLSDVPKLNKSVSSPSFETFRTFRRKQADMLAFSVENILSQRSPEMPDPQEKPEKKTLSSKSHGHSNVSVSSSSGLDSPIKCDRRKRRVSIQFKKKPTQTSGSHQHEEEKESLSSRRNSLMSSVKASGCERRKLKGKNDETDATTSERERTNSVSSRTSSIVASANGSRRKFSTSSNRTYLNDEKIPWCGCWGNGCV